MILQLVLVCLFFIIFTYVTKILLRRDSYCRPQSPVIRWRRDRQHETLPNDVSLAMAVVVPETPSLAQNVTDLSHDDAPPAYHEALPPPSYEEATANSTIIPQSSRQPRL